MARLRLFNLFFAKKLALGVVMRVKNAFKVLISNFKLIYKSAFMRLICTAIFVALGYFAVYSHVEPIISNENTVNLLHATRDLFVKFLAGEGLDTHRLPEAFSAFMDMMKQEQKNVLIAIVEVFGVLFLLRVALNTFEYAFAKIINGFMSARSHYGVLVTLCLDFGKALAYSFLYVLINFVIEIAIFIVTTAILIYGLPVISVFAIFFAILFFALTLAFKRSITSSFLPNIVVDGMEIGKALVNTSPKTRKHFASLFGSYFFIMLIVFYLNVSFAVFTFFTGLAITIPITGLYYTTLALVDKYCVNQKRFYTDDDHIAFDSVLSEHSEFTKLMD